jgi:hypothetical protein
VTAQGGNCALAEVIVAIDTSAAAIRILNVVIVILRIVVMCGEFAPAIAAALLKTLPGDFLDKRYVGVASKKAHQVNFTLARTAFGTRHGHLNSVDDRRGLANAMAEHRPEILFRFLK